MMLRFSCEQRLVTTSKPISHLCTTYHVLNKILLLTYFALDIALGRPIKPGAHVTKHPNFDPILIFSHNALENLGSILTFLWWNVMGVKIPAKTKHLNLYITWQYALLCYRSTGVT